MHRYVGHHCIGHQPIRHCDVDMAPKRQVARGAGADEVVDASGPWKDEVKILTAPKAVDVVLDPVGAPPPNRRFAR